MVRRNLYVSLKVTCIQQDIVFGNPKQNRQNVEKNIEKAMQENPDVIVLPEMWTTGYDLARLAEIGDENGEKTKAMMSSLAQKYQVNIVAGSVAKSTGNKHTNTLYAFDRQGECISEYSKVHLFKLMDEHHYLVAGDEKGLFTLEGMTCAGLICYDIRFPEWVRAHTVNGAKAIFVVAEWPLPRLAHWRHLLISRAIENQCYVIACNRSGKDPNNEFAGHSMIIDPWGEVLKEAKKEPEMITSTIDLEKVTQVRKQIPIFDDRRPEIY